MIRVLIVDDEQTIREDLITLLSKNRDYSIIGTCSSVTEAALVIPAIQPDVLLLDIEMRDGTGFDLLSSLEQINFQTIFVTGYEQYAVMAIKYGALDYLFKPVDEDELWEALDKVKRIKKQEAGIRDSLRVAQHYYDPGQNRADRIVLPSLHTLQVVSFDEILYCESSASYTHFHLKDKRKIVVTKPLIDYEQLLPHQQFLRCHHSFLVNGSYIDYYHNDGYLVLKGGQPVVVSRRKKERVISFLGGS